MIIALVPAYNEEDSIETVVTELLLVVDRVVVIDDASVDATGDIAEHSGAIVLHHKLNRGQGAALETGHAYARSIDADLVLHFDADRQFLAEEVPGAIAAFRKEKADILLGSRFLEKHSSVPFMKRHAVLPLGRLFDRMLTGLKLSDSHNGFRILNKKALSAIRLTQDRMAHASEIPALIKKHDLKYIEFPVTVRYVEYGQGARGGLHIIKDTLTGMFLR